jgi:RHS repeat-associated protein
MGRVISITDSLNRTVTISYKNQTTPYDQITYSGVGGVPRTLRIGYVNLASALRPDATLQTEQVLFPELSGSTSSNVNPPVISYLEYQDGTPNGRRYQFYYDSYAELARVVLPTGGMIDYDYEGGVISSHSIYRRITQRRTYVDQSTLVGKTTYSRTSSPNYCARGTCTENVTVDYVDPTTTPSETLLGREIHYFNGNPTNSLVNYEEFAYAVWNEGLEYKTELLKEDGYTVLRRVEQNWQPRITRAWAAEDPRVIETTTTLVDTNQVTKHSTINPSTGAIGFDQYNNPTDMWEYNYGSGSAPTYATRHTQTAYLTTNPTNGLDYASPTPTSSSIHIRNLSQEQKVYAVNPQNGVETLLARSTTAYDQGIPSDCLNIVGHDSAFSTSYAPRGNATSATVYKDALNGTGPLTTSVAYDIAGNVVQSTDAKGNVSGFSYGDSFSDTVNRNTYAFLTHTTSAVPDSTGTYGSTTPLQTASVYDYWTGHTTTVTDANSKVTSLQYDDSLDRLTAVIRPDTDAYSNHGTTTYSYQDTIGSLYVRTQVKQNAAQATDSYQYFDGLGRPYRSFQYTNSDLSNPWQTGDTQYDALGRVWRVSSPYLSSGSASAINPSGKWSTRAFDALSRMVTVTTPDSAAVATSYSGNTVTVTDQASKSRKSVTDGLGRLTQVYEAPNDSNYNYLTSYAYDALDDLTSVTQGTQPARSFVYDSLKRLSSATNPESGTINYIYDSNGNLTQKTDARGVVSTYTYDALNRNTSVTYTNDPANAPMVTRTYDGATNGVGRLWKTETAGAAASRTTIDGYDALGRPLKLQQQFYDGKTPWVSYWAHRTYDLAGGVLTQTYPSGHTVDYAYDAAGRISSFTGNLGEGVTRTYANDFQYTERGAIQQEKFGTTTPLYHKQRFNQRGQLWDMRLSTVAFNADPANGDRGAIVNYYSGTFAPGGSGADNNGNLLRQEIYIPGSSFFQDNFAYDSLNRLTSISEKLNGTGDNTFKQAYSYDRWGNRTFDQANTTANVPHPAYTVNASNNRLIAPQGYLYEWDAAGNQTRDTYPPNSSLLGQRTYDAENRMISAQVTKGSTPSYTYNGDGQRVRRKLGYETWQVYGFDGELLAEYPQTGPSVAVVQPQKEYGYRNGQLLITAEPFVNAAWNKPATQIDDQAPTTTANKAVDGNADGDLADSHASATNYHEHSWWQVDLQSVQTISSITVWGRTDCCPEMTSNFYVFVSDNPFTSYDFNATMSQPGVDHYLNAGYAGPASIEVNRTGRYVRVQLAGTQSLVLGEVQVWSQAAKVNWLVTDHLGTPRMIVDKTGSLAGISRHDYLPFGEELFAGTGGRTQAQGYSANDNVRQHFTQKERDNETGLDYFLARYYSSTQGRFTGVDPQNIVFEKEQGRNAGERARILQSYLVQPQNWNKYAYTRNNPLAYTDPNGRCSAPSGLAKGNVGICIEAFIASPTFGSRLLQGVGDNRGFAANDPSKTFRIEVLGTITPGRGTSGWSYDLKGNAGVSQAVVGGVVELGAQGTIKYDVKTTGIDKDGTAHLAITMTGINGFSSVPGAPQGEITLNVNLVVTPDGKVGIEGGDRTAYPSVGIYTYTMGSDGQPRAATLGEGRETTIDALTKPTVPIQW